MKNIKNNSGGIIKRRAAALLLCVLAAAGFHSLAQSGGGIADMAQVVEGLKLPLQRYENGRVRTMLSADRARMTNTTVIAEGNILIQLMAEDGSTNGLARAEKGVFNQHDDTAQCYGPVYMEFNGNQLTGTNLYWNSKLHLVRVETNATLTIFSGDSKQTGITE